MRLLFDENLSPLLVKLLQSNYAGSAHIAELDMEGRPDLEIWAAAREHGFTIVTKDDDFRELSFVYGAPPKVIWLQIGNAGTAEVARLLSEHSDLIGRFVAEPEDAILILPVAPPAER